MGVFPVNSPQRVITRTCSKPEVGEKVVDLDKTVTTLATHIWLVDTCVVSVLLVV